MRYVVVCVLQGAAGAFNNQMRKEVWVKLKAKSSKLPAHFTIKAPFEHDGPITALEGILESCCKEEKAEPFRLEGYGHFSDRVVYMNVNMSLGGKTMHDRFIDAMGVVPYVAFDEKDGKDKIFHVTVASKRIQPAFDKIWEYANSKPCDFDCQFDNISIYKWQDNTWVLHRIYQLQH